MDVYEPCGNNYRVAKFTKIVKGCCRNHYLRFESDRTFRICLINEYSYPLRTGGLTLIIEKLRY